MLARVLVRGGVAAADVSAGSADPQVNPGGPDLEAVLAALELVGLLDRDLVEVRAVDHKFESIE
jgi:hypothetical protein